MKTLEQLQQNLDILVENLNKISEDIKALQGNVQSEDMPNVPYWIDYIFPPGSNLLRFKCSNCGYISTYRMLSCPRCKEYIGR